MHIAKAHTHVRCPVCGQHPPKARLWLCISCKHRIDPFILGICLVCEKSIDQMECPFCNARTNLSDWYNNEFQEI